MRPATGSPEVSRAELGDGADAKAGAAGGVRRALAYRPEIDGLRAVAVIPVVLFHLGAPGFSGGFVGVDVFFVISGYLITGILKRELDQNRLSLVGFYKRRVRRIIPALFVMSFAVAVATYRWLPPRELISVADALASVGVFASNIYFYLHSGYWDAASRDHPLLHTWSLAVEEQFYIFFPILLAALHRLRSGLRVTLAGLGIASLGASAWAAGAAPEAGFYLFPFRAFELIIGALIACDAVSLPPLRWARGAATTAGLALIAAAVVGFSQVTPFPGVAALAPCVGAGLVILGGGGAPRPLSQALLMSPPLRFVGLISYSLYLWHWPVIVFSKAALGREFTPLDQLTLGALALALGTASWALVERPFRRPATRFPATACAAGMGLAGAALALFVAQQAHARHGWSNRLPPDLAAVEAQGRRPWGDGACFLERDETPAMWRGAACVIAGTKPTRVLWWGDSFAAHYGAALVEARGTLPFSIIDYSYAGCPPVFGFQPAIAPNCGAFNENAWRLIAANHVEVVVLAARWEAAQKRGLSPGQLTPTVAALRAHGLKVIVIGQSPSFVADVTRILAWRRLREKSGAPAEPVTFAPDLNARLAAAAAGAEFVDPMAAFCHGQLCELGQGREAWFIDDGHLSIAGARKVLPLIVPAIERALGQAGADARGGGGAAQTAATGRGR